MMSRAISPEAVRLTRYSFRDSSNPKTEASLSPYESSRSSIPYGVCIHTTTSIMSPLVLVGTLDFTTSYPRCHLINRFPDLLGVKAWGAETHVGKVRYRGGEGRPYTSQLSWLMRDRLVTARGTHQTTRETRGAGSTLA